MGVIAPLYLAGLAALSLPLIFHLIRRTPRGRREFSSLMFLLPSPPRLTRRSRLDQILLLLLRLVALALLAFAFARPFLRETATLALEDLPARRVAILVDASASMRRGDLWNQALSQIEKELANLGPHDEVALYTFADRLQTQVGFESSSAEVEAAGKRLDIVRAAAKKLRPTWQSTDLAAALVEVARELDATSDVKQQTAEPQVIVISDFQKTARLEALQGMEWPKRVQMVARQLTAKRTTNAAAQLLTSEEDSPLADARVRVVNAANSKDEQFYVAWSANPASSEGAKSQPSSETAVYVPVGQSRVVKLPRPEESLAADRIVLRGDDDEFDNTFFVAPPRKQQVTIVFFGDDAAKDRQGRRYYLEIATSDDPLRQVTIEAPAASDGSKFLTVQPPPQVAVVTTKLAPQVRASLKQFAESGGTLVLAPDDEEAAQEIASFVDDIELVAKSASGDYLLLGEIDFSHPLFAPFSNPRYSDFTKIHFWKHGPLALKESAQTKVVAKFDSGEPAILERASGRGRIIVFASGWQPDESELALSTKFVPLIGALLDMACGSNASLAGVTVGESVDVASISADQPLVVHKPDGAEVAAVRGEANFAEVDQPGVYEIRGAATPVLFAANLAAAESNTASLELEKLEQLGVNMKSVLSRKQELDRKRQERDTELESRQKIWRWLLAGALGVLVLETFLAGRAARQIATAEALA
jgi:hypothetical protein